MLIYGRNAVKEALLSDANIVKVFIREGITGAESQEVINIIKNCGIEYKFVPKSFLERKAQGLNHQGFVADISEFKYSEVKDILDYANSKGEQLFLCILEGIEDPHNLGSIIRTCECAGVHGIVIEKNRACDVNGTVIKVSAGASSHIKVAKVANIPQLIDNLKHKGIWVYNVEINGSSIYSTNLKGDIAIVVGSEGRGTRPIIQKKCDGIISLPMFGKVNSLNASNACAIALYEAVRQRKGGN